MYDDLRGSAFKLPPAKISQSFCKGLVPPFLGDIHPMPVFAEPTHCDPVTHVTYVGLASRRVGAEPIDNSHSEDRCDCR